MAHVNDYLRISRGNKFFGPSVPLVVNNNNKFSIKLAMIINNLRL